MTTLLKKLSVKGVCGNIKTPEPGVTVPLMVIMGYAKTLQVKPTLFGDSIGFHGDFKAIDVTTGEEFRSGVCYLPDVAASLLSNALDVSGGSAVEFAFNIGIIGVAPRVEGETGKYEYRCAALMNASENDPLRALEARLKQGRLDAPKASEEPKVSIKKGGK